MAYYIICKGQKIEIKENREEKWLEEELDKLAGGNRSIRKIRRNERKGKGKIKRKKKRKKKNEESRNIQIRMNYRKDLEDYRWINQREQVLKRDNYTCQKCGAKTNLQVHHLKYIPGRRPWEYKRELLITLCSSCHKKEHLPEIKAREGSRLLDEEFSIRLYLDK